MLLGIDFFLSHRIYVSKARSKMFVTYNGGTVFALNRSETAGAAAAAVNGVASGAGAAGSADVATADQLARRGAASASRRDFERALADLDRAIALEPASAAFLAQRGVIHEALKRPAKALEDFDRALELDASQSDARLQRAVLRLRSMNLAGAKADLDALDAALPPQAQMRLPMSRFYLGLELPKQSLVQLNHWLPAHPNQVDRHDALNSRCWIRMTLGIELDKAVDDCDDAIDADPKNAHYADSRGWLYLRLGRLPKALADFDRSLELEPLAPWSLYGRALTRARLGHTAQASVDLASARKAQPDIDARVAKVGLPTAVPAH